MNTAQMLEQYLARGGKIKKIKRGASQFDVLAPATIRQKIHAQTVQVGKLRKRKKASKP
jgi:hypothetical protein